MLVLRKWTEPSDPGRNQPRELLEWPNRSTRPDRVIEQPVALIIVPHLQQKSEVGGPGLQCETRWIRGT
jgi:hypothetical protein